MACSPVLKGNIKVTRSSDWISQKVYFELQTGSKLKVFHHEDFLSKSGVISYHLVFFYWKRPQLSEELKNGTNAVM